ATSEAAVHGVPQHPPLAADLAYVGDPLHGPGAETLEALEVEVTYRNRQKRRQDLLRKRPAALARLHQVATGEEPHLAQRYRDRLAVPPRKHMGRRDTVPRKERDRYVTLPSCAVQWQGPQQAGDAVGNPGVACGIGGKRAAIRRQNEARHLDQARRGLAEIAFEDIDRRHRIVIEIE